MDDLDIFRFYTFREKLWSEMSGEYSRTLQTVDFVVNVFGDLHEDVAEDVVSVAVCMDEMEDFIHPVVA